MEYKTFTHLVYEAYPFLTKVKLNPQNLKKKKYEGGTCSITRVGLAVWLSQHDGLGLAVIIW